MSKHIVVIGAGIGGTATAARLAREGFRVTVVEKNDFSGGRCSLIHHGGYRFDQGPSLYLMPKLFEDAFADLDERVEDHLELLRCENNYKVHFDDGESIHLTSDLTRMKTEMERVEGPEGFGRFLDFLRETHVHYQNGTWIALKKNFESIWDLIRLEYAPEILRLHLFDKIYRRASLYFKTKRMRMAFTFQTMYMGMSPYDAPAVYSLLQYTEFAEGIWYPRGGFNQVVQKLESIATQKYRATFRYNAPVAKINTDSGRVCGVTLENGEVIEADAVVCNADLVYAYHKLLPPCSWTTKTLASKKLTSSSISFYWSMNKKIPQFDVHNIFLAESYKESFDEIFEQYGLPSEASFYVNVPSRVDPSAAPDGKDSVIVLVPIGHMKSQTGEGEDYADLVNRAREMVLSVIQSRLGIKDFASMIEHEIVNDPKTWQAKFNLWRGSILGLSHNVFQVLWFRPSTRDTTNRYRNLFFVGASTHPGTGVPIVLAGSKLTSDQVCKHFGKTPLPRKLGYTPQPKDYVEKSHGEPSWFSIFAVIVFLLSFFFAFFPEQSTGHTAASFINSYLPKPFQVEGASSSFWIV
ncbi:phytoene dehydrogenase [Rhizopus microsporus var. microsporus]|uniref:Phytoene desaturase n=2 Tax=Rhizopus microsporus TaxID=58291 RepID=A0A2G4SFW1_RHIZD|nr:phytoene dehydrogenase [Rhizopus microsporus ATCC 52813]ORE02407.1 phytoene dehydrogenase [Rhizopus microsporus var. microsporus]PHZ07654.1 phytoene dehydrogenase [Rhizopus microsporus ATCC 52813]